MHQTAEYGGLSLRSYDDPRATLIHYRLMEKENKKAREDARKEYNETIRVRVPIPATLQINSDLGIRSRWQCSFEGVIHVTRATLLSKHEIIT